MKTETNLKLIETLNNTVNTATEIAKTVKHDTVLIGQVAAAVVLSLFDKK